MEDPVKRVQNVVIVGTQRSGTTLLQKLISENFNFATAFESYFIPIFGRYKFLWGDLSKYENREKMLGAIFLYLELRYSAADKLTKKTKEQHTLLACKRNAKKIIEESKSYRTLVQNLFRYYCIQKEKEGFVEKTAYHDWPPFPTLGNVFENTLFVHLIRNPLDTYSSWKETWFSPKYASTAARIWKRINRNCYDWGSQNSGRYILIKYEDLISNPEGQISRLRKYLKVQKKMMEKNVSNKGSLFDNLSRKSWFKNINSDIGLKNRNVSLSHAEAGIIANLVNEEAAKYNYKLNAFLEKKRNFNIVLFAQKIMEFFTFNSMRRKVEKHFPLVIKIAQTTGTEKLLLKLTTSN
ncbi:sulfotransferase family protein [Microbulbifer thermotolerans]|uniref:sulfotransferase family protein n=1 Tax=Microbulbifer thermotolerans TaxID=252514 RepID=UPI00224A57D2|nr:sulfotransferase [Microbulbifer thermotolerans]MCX2780729.1 sulfotransferase [Microbulbifer thermotolerans]MCX2806472.1 sulfotransferase [Microbulbifer thermotolerans]MCX2841583.1 sulfotransferase [Microbulbifer thermotolerans]